MRHALLTALATTAVLAGCGDGSGDGSSAPSPATDTISIKDFEYAPQEATVKLGTKVSVPNADDAPHTLTDRSGKRTFTSGTIEGGKTGSVTFRAAGSFEYFCEFHPYMKGKVVVAR